MTDAQSPIDANKFVPFSDDLERPRPDEAELITKIIGVLRRNNEWAYKKQGHAIRDAHAKTHGVLRGELTVRSGLSEPYKQGLFATPATYPIVARISATSGAIRSDQIRGVRGLAIKVLGVPGPRAIPDDATTQDFVFVNRKVFPFADAHAYLRRGMPVAWTLAHTPDWGLLATGSVLRAASGIISRIGGKLPSTLELFAGPNRHILGETFYTAAPLRYGNYVAKLSVAPHSESVKALRGIELTSDGPEAHREAIVDFFRTNTAEYEVGAQLCTSPEEMPIEDATKEWSEEKSPYEPVATISYPAQDPYSPERQFFGDDVLSFNSWRAIAEHRPLGSINRLKRDVYDASSHFRHDKNNVPEREPADAAELPR